MTTRFQAKTLELRQIIGIYGNHICNFCISRLESKFAVIFVGVSQTFCTFAPELRRSSSQTPLDPGKQIEHVEYLPAELVPENPGKKNSVVDVRCRETGGRHFIVEMQLNWNNEFRQRVILNAAKAVVKQLKPGR